MSAVWPRLSTDGTGVGKAGLMIVRVITARWRRDQPKKSFNGGFSTVADRSLPRGGG